MAIRFTQYMMPNGRKVPKDIERPEAIEGMANTVRQFGGEFSIEVLTTGEVAMSIERDETVLAMEVVTNGPEVPKAVDRIVRMAHRVLSASHRRQQR